jgi:hypothetical protein
LFVAIDHANAAPTWAESPPGVFHIRPGHETRLKYGAIPRRIAVRRKTPE